MGTRRAERWNPHRRRERGTGCPLNSTFHFPLTGTCRRRTASCTCSTTRSSSTERFLRGTCLGLLRCTICCYCACVTLHFPTNSNVVSYPSFRPPRIRERGRRSASRRPSPAAIRPSEWWACHHAQCSSPPAFIGVPHHTARPPSSHPISPSSPISTSPIFPAHLRKRTCVLSSNSSQGPPVRHHREQRLNWIWMRVPLRSVRSPPFPPPCIVISYVAPPALRRQALAAALGNTNARACAHTL